MICSLVPFIVATIAIIDAMPMIIPSIVSRDLSLWLQIPWKERDIFSIIDFSPNYQEQFISIRQVRLTDLVIHFFDG